MLEAIVEGGGVLLGLGLLLYFQVLRPETTAARDRVTGPEGGDEHDRTGPRH